MESDFRRILFDGWHNWLSYLWKAIVGFVMCLISILYAIAGGVLSVLVYVSRKTKRFVVTYPVPVLALLCIILVLCVLFLFVSYTAKVKSCQMELDSIAYEKMKLEQAFVGDTIVIRGYSTTARNENPIDSLAQ